MLGTMNRSGHLRARVRWSGVVVAMAALTAGIVAATPSTPAHASINVVARHRGEVGPFGPVTVIGDSVLNGSVYQQWGVTLDDHLVAQGWGPIRIRSGVGMSALSGGDATAPYWIRQWRAAGWDPPAVVVNLGANDSAACKTDSACAYRRVMDLVDAIGPGKRIWWAKVTHHPVVHQWADTWNAALDRVAAEQPDFHTWDWPSVMRSGAFPSSDGIHLTAAGYGIRSGLMATDITSVLARAGRTGGPAALPAPAGDPTTFVPIATTRVLDTRRDGPWGPAGVVGAQRARPVDVSAVVPEGATAVAAYVSATNTAGPGFLTSYECGTTLPTASSANYLANQSRGALTIVPLDEFGRFCLYTYAQADLLVDVQGAFVPDRSGPAAGLGLRPVAPPQRLVDTRVDGRSQVVRVTVPGRPAAAVVNLTAVAGDEAGYLTAYPCAGDVPLSATVNYMPHDVVAGAAFVPVADDGTFCVYTMSTRADVVVDVTGTFTPADAPGALAFVPAPPTRTIDTRNGIGGWSPIHGGTQTIDTRVAPSGAVAVSGTITITDPVAAGFLTAWGCGALPPTSNVNAVPGTTFANFVTVGVGDGQRMCVYAWRGTGTVFDTTGWWVPA